MLIKLLTMSLNILQCFLLVVGSTLTLQFMQSFLVSQALELTVHCVLWFVSALIPLVSVVVDRISQVCICFSHTNDNFMMIYL